MYKYRQNATKYTLSVDNHCEIVDALLAFCSEKNIKSGSISGIGAIDRMTLRFFNPSSKKYEDREFCEQMEIASLLGNVSTLDGKTYLHLHIVAGRSDYSTIGGHLLSARLSGAGEFFVEDFGDEIEREYSSEIGLNVYKFE